MGAVITWGGDDDEKINGDCPNLVKSFTKVVL